ELIFGNKDYAIIGKDYFVRNSVFILYVIATGRLFFLWFFLCEILNTIIMRKNYFLALGLLFSAFTMQAQTEYVDGILVLNEGGMGTSQGSVSYINAGGQVTNNIFQAANEVNELGDVAQGMVSDGEVTLIMLNGSSKVEVVDAKTFVSLVTIDEGVILPRYALIHEGKAYVTCWGNDETGAYLAVIDMESYEVENTVSLSSGVEQIYEKDNKLYVLHMGGFNTNN